MNIVNAMPHTVNFLGDDGGDIQVFSPVISIRVSKNDDSDMEKRKCKM